VSWLHVPVDLSALQSVWPLVLEMETAEASFLVYQSGGRSTLNWSRTYVKKNLLSLKGKLFPLRSGILSVRLLQNDESK